MGYRIIKTTTLDERKRVQAKSTGHNPKAPGELAAKKEAALKAAKKRRAR